MALTFELIPLLQTMHDLYSHPRGSARFKEYLDVLTAGTQEMQVPIAVMNPMAKEHVRGVLERLIAIDAEGVALDAAREAAELLSHVEDHLRLAVVLADDAKGGWTNRIFTEFATRYERKYEVARAWATTILWSNEEPSRELVRTRTLESIYRTLDERRHGAVRTVREIMDREGRTMRFAGRAQAQYDAATLVGIRSRIEPHRDSLAAPVIFAALYGDDAAASLGYPKLGIPERGGYELALYDANAVLVG